MLEFNLSLILLAEDTQPAPGGLGSMMVPLIVIMVLFYFMILKPQKNKEQSLKNNEHSMKNNKHSLKINDKSHTQKQPL